MLTYIYDARYLLWRLGDGHPTNPVRASNALALIEAMGVPHEVISPRAALPRELALVHDPAYVARVQDGQCDEWDGRQPRLGKTASVMAGGTMVGVDLILDGRATRVFNPQGAKHHAHRAHSSGFCVYNDMAMAAARFAAEGMRVAYLDWDVHHGDGVEALLADSPMCLTASVHTEGFPGTGNTGFDDARHVHNIMLADGASGDTWLSAIESMLDRIREFRPDVILLAAGADAHALDPMSTLGVHVEHYEAATAYVTKVADAMCEGRILAGGAGGYLPSSWTPLAWAAVAHTLAATT